MSDFPAIPPSDVTMIEQSPHRQEIFDKLLSGWSPARISRSIERQHGVLIPAHTIVAFGAQIPKGWALEESELAKRQKQIDVQVDALLEMQRVLLLLRDRLDDALLLEEVSKKQLETEIDHHNARPDTIVEHRAAVFFKHLREYVETMHDVGELRPPVIELEMKATVPTIREVMRNTIEGAKRKALP